jgi:hypothetical protein
LRPAHGFERAPVRQEIERGKLLEHTNRIGGAKDGDRAGEANSSGAGCRRSENHRWGGIQELAPVMLTHAENVNSNLIGKLDLTEQVAKQVVGLNINAAGRRRNRSGETVYSNFYHILLLI